MADEQAHEEMGSSVVWSSDLEPLSWDITNFFGNLPQPPAQVYARVAPPSPLGVDGPTADDKQSS